MLFLFCALLAVQGVASGKLNAETWENEEVELGPTVKGVTSCMGVSLIRKSFFERIKGLFVLDGSNRGTN